MRLSVGGAVPPLLLQASRTHQPCCTSSTHTICIPGALHHTACIEWGLEHDPCKDRHDGVCRAVREGRQADRAAAPGFRDSRDQISGARQNGTAADTHTRSSRSSRPAVERERTDVDSWTGDVRQAEPEAAPRPNGRRQPLSDNWNTGGGAAGRSSAGRGFTSGGMAGAQTAGRGVRPDSSRVAFGDRANLERPPSRSAAVAGYAGVRQPPRTQQKQQQAPAAPPPPSDFMRRRGACYGCGARLQLNVPMGAGYVSPEKYAVKKQHRQLDQVLCERCAGLSNGAMIPAVADFSQRVQQLQDSASSSTTETEAVETGSSHHVALLDGAASSADGPATSHSASDSTAPTSSTNVDSSTATPPELQYQQHGRRTAEQMFEYLQETEAAAAAPPRMGKALVSPEELRGQLMEVRGKKALVVMLVDLLDAAGSLMSTIRDVVGANPIILVGTKMDLLPADSPPREVAAWLEDAATRKRLNVVSTHLVSSHSGEGVAFVTSKLAKERKGRDVYVVGAANVGKSAFVRAVLKEMSRAEGANFDPGALGNGRYLPVESAMPGTTLGIIPLRAFAAGGCLYDTPGVHLHHRVPHMLTPDELRLLHPRKRLTAIVPLTPAELATVAAATHNAVTSTSAPLQSVADAHAQQQVAASGSGAATEQDSLPDAEADGTDREGAEFDESEEDEEAEEDEQSACASTTRFRRRGGLGLGSHSSLRSSRSSGLVGRYKGTPLTLDDFDFSSPPTDGVDEADDEVSAEPAHLPSPLPLHAKRGKPASNQAAGPSPVSADAPAASVKGSSSQQQPAMGLGGLKFSSVTDPWEHLGEDLSVSSTSAAAKRRGMSAAATDARSTLSNRLSPATASNAAAAAAASGDVTSSGISSSSSVGSVAGSADKLAATPVATSGRVGGSSSNSISRAVNGSSSGRSVSASYSWSDLVRLDVLSGPPSTALAFYGPGSLRVVGNSLQVQPESVTFSDTTANADDGRRPISSNVNTTSDTTSTSGVRAAAGGAAVDGQRSSGKWLACAESVRARGGLQPHDLTVHASSGGRAALADVAVSGLPGWVTLWAPFAKTGIQLRVWAPKGVEVFLRPPLPCPNPLRGREDSNGPEASPDGLGSKTLAALAGSGTLDPFQDASWWQAMAELEDAGEGEDDEVDDGYLLDDDSTASPAGSHDRALSKDGRIVVSATVEDILRRPRLDPALADWDEEEEEASAERRRRSGKDAKSSSTNGSSRGGSSRGGSRGSNNDRFAGGQAGRGSGGGSSGSRFAGARTFPRSVPVARSRRSEARQTDSQDNTGFASRGTVVQEPWGDVQ